MSTLNLCVIGDELAAGAEDPRGLGWVGRVIARTEMPFGARVFSLCRERETTMELAQRWEAEVSARLREGVDNRVLIAIGSADVDSDLSTARTRLNIANMVDIANRMELRPLVVGPPPLRCSDMRQLFEISKAAAEVCRRRDVPFIDTFTPLMRHDQWLDDVAVNDGRLPSQAGYGLMAWIVLHRGWYEWTGLSARQR